VGNKSDIGQGASMTSYRKNEAFKNECGYAEDQKFTAKKSKTYLTAFSYLVREFTKNLAEPLGVAFLKYTKTEGMEHLYKPVVIKGGTAYLNLHAIDSISDVDQKEESSMHLHNKIIGMVFGIYDCIREEYNDPDVAKDFVQLVRMHWSTASATCVNILRASGKKLKELLVGLDLEFIDNPAIIINEIGVGDTDGDDEWDEPLETEEKGDTSDDEDEGETEVEIEWDVDWT
jgi:hypothetical protein